MQANNPAPHDTTEVHGTLTPRSGPRSGWLPLDGNGHLTLVVASCTPPIPTSSQVSLFNHVWLVGAPGEDPTSGDDSHSIVSSIINYLNPITIRRRRYNFTVRSTVKKCCLGAIEVDRCRMMN